MVCVIKGAFIRERVELFTFKPRDVLFFITLKKDNSASEKENTNYIYAIRENLQPSHHCLKFLKPFPIGCSLQSLITN